MFATLAERFTAEGRARMGDAAMALALTVFAWAQASVRPFLGRGFPFPMPVGGGGGVRPDHAIFRVAASPLTFVLIGLAFLPLVVRRRYPVTVLMVTTAATAFYEITSNPPSFTVIGALIALYTVGTLVDRRRLLLWGSISTAAILAASLPAPSSDQFWVEAVRNLSVLLVAALLGDATRNRRAYVAEVEQRALEAERTREEETRRRVDEERLRIARELHDVTAHSLSVIAVQSGAGAHVIDSNPAEAKKSLIAIRQTSRDALQELRAMLGVLRGTEDKAEVPLTPTAGLARLRELVPPLEEAGLTVAVRMDPDIQPVSALVDASAYRIVQEALTNALRHAPGSRVTVDIRRDAEALQIEVADDGPGAQRGTGEGHGIAGMRERAAALGGTFAAGPGPDGGWRVHARLPVGGRP